MTFATEVMVDSPLIWWDTRQASGVLQPDRSGNGYTGTITGSPVLSVDGLTFDNTTTGDDEYIKSDSTFGPVSYSTFAFEVVVEVAAWPSGSSIFMFDDSPAEDAFSGVTANSAGHLFGRWNTPADAAVSLDTVSAVDVGTKVHFVAEWDGTTAHVYVDGVEVATAAGGLYDGMEFFLAETLVLATDMCACGDGFNGLVRHGIFYNHSLGATRVAAHAAAALSDDPAGSAAIVTPPSDADLLDLRFGGQRVDTFSVDLIDSARNPLGSLSVEVGGSVQLDTSRTVFRYCSGVTVTDPPDDLDLTRHRAQVKMTLQNGSVFSLGVFMFGEDARHPFASHEVWTPQMFDETFLLQQRLDRTWSLAKGKSLLGFFTDMAAEVLAPLGIPFEYDVPDYPSGAPLTYKVGSPRIDALNSVASALGCFPPFFDNDGVHGLRVAPETVAVADHSYGVGTRIFDDTTTLTSSLYQAHNRWIVLGKDLGSGTVKGIYDLPPEAPNSKEATGRIVTADPHSVPGIASPDVARLMAYADALTDLTNYGRAEFAASVDPRHGTFDTVDLFDVLYLENGWSLPLEAGGDHTHQLTIAFGQ